MSKSRGRYFQFSFQLKYFAFFQILISILWSKTPTKDLFYLRIGQIIIKV